jgi:selenium-binding protein 1
MIEISRDGKRVYPTNSLYAAWEEVLYPEGIGAWMARFDAGGNGGLSLDARFFPHGDDFLGPRVHQTRLRGGDASSDSYCFVD